jgi:hypothetical protein
MAINVVSAGLAEFSGRTLYRTSSRNWRITQIVASEANLLSL